MPRTNQDRADNGDIALNAYADHIGTPRGDDSLLCDLLADLRHWAKWNKVDIDNAWAMSGTHFNAEDK